ncbi:Protein Njmu-R1 [Frankliniella fusca]|uniref:Protein Njmu-R1 n=1 Tax=Frankliniella fusca TaxID=407009 RepID=A0AAE1HSH2_9NEOP|nr:Protein Njmu-R1 [Frankliniella fusca]
MRPEKTVEIDESLFNKRKHNKGKKSVCQQWVFSGAEQGSRVILCQITTRSKMKEVKVWCSTNPSQVMNDT